MTEKLTMSFDRRTIEHLGVKMYSTLPPVLAELVANSYDAGASKVFIDLNDQGNSKEIVVRDDGIGMSLADMDQNSSLLAGTGVKTQEIKHQSEAESR